MRLMIKNRQILLQIFILILSNIVITSVTIYIAYNQSIRTHEKNLTDIVMRQKAIIDELWKQGKSETEIIAILRDVHSIGKNGEFTIANIHGDSVNYILANGKNPNFRLDQHQQIGYPMRLALQGRTGFVKALDYQGVKVYAAYTYFKSFKWGIIAKMPVAEINKPYVYAALVSLLVSILLLLIWILLFRKISDPLLQKILDSEEHYRSLFAKNHVSMLVINPVSLFIADANQAACKYYGYKHDLITSLPYTDILQLSEDETRKLFQKIKKNVITETYFKHQLSNGEIRDVEISHGDLKIRGEKLIYAIIYDVTERFETDKRLKDSEETYRTLFSSINDAVLVSTLNPDGTVGPFIQVNDIACERLGYTHEEMLRLKPTDIHSINTKSIGLQVVETLKKDHKAIFELEHVSRNGKIIPVEISTRLSRLKDKTIIHSIVRDISERKGMEGLLQKNLNLMRMTQKMAKIGGWEWNLKEDTMYWTEETYHIHEINPEELMGGSGKYIAESLKCYPPEYYQEIMDHFKLCVEKGESYDLESPFTTFQGRKIWIRTAGQAEWQDGKIVKVIGTISDITSQKQDEILLKEKAEEIESQNEEYKQINSELFYAKQKAEENDRLKTAFLQNMSHEIRTPMNAIMGFSELLTENFNNKEKLEDYSNIINQRCSDLLELINEILDVAKIESGQLDIHLEEFSINDMFGEMLILFKELQKKYNKPGIKLSIRNQFSNFNTLILTDKIKLKQVLINLISNSLKFTEEGHIEIGCKPEKGNQLTFYVADTGIGIPSDKHEFIFERFTQIRNEHKPMFRGTGLGLSIVQGLINLLEGKIWLESEINKGSTFYFSITCKITSGSMLNQQTDQGLQEYLFPGNTILIVEDDNFNASYLKEVLSKTGLNILHAKLGRDAIDYSLTQKIDLILLDIGLPDINGYEVCRAILQTHPELKIIAQTAYAAVSDREKAFASGCIDYLSKPLKRKELFSTISKYLSVN